MSEQLISRSPDLKRLWDEGYNLEVRNEGYLFVRDVPYVTAKRTVRRAVLGCPLEVGGDVAIRPSDHTMRTSGQYPCNADGTPIEEIRHQDINEKVGDVTFRHSFSSKPPSGYPDYYEKVTTYVRILEGPAQALDRAANARSRATVEASEADSVFRYLDTASSRAGLVAASKKLEVGKLAIVGLGGTGAYVLDLVAKTPVPEIHLFDRDEFLNHNAFRCPGAASLEELRANPKKVDYLAERYSPMRRGIIPHPVNITAENVDELDEMSFVFLCLDDGPGKGVIADRLESREIPFIDVGMGLDEHEARVGGILRVTASFDGHHEAFSTRVSTGPEAADDVYDRNIQVADLNALNAGLAVIKWKKHCDFYRDYGRELHTTFTTDTNMLLNENAIED